MKFHEYAKNGELNKLEELLKQGVEIDVLDEGGFTALMRAAVNGQNNSTRLLITKGAKTNIQSTKDGNTALHLAAANDHFEVVQELVAVGADLFIKDTLRKFTALELALNRGHLKTAAFLQAAIASVRDQFLTDKINQLTLIVEQQSAKIEALESLTSQQTITISALQVQANTQIQQMQTDADHKWKKQLEESSEMIAREHEFCARATRDLTNLFAGDPSQSTLHILRETNDSMKLLLPDSSLGESELLKCVNSAAERKKNCIELLCLLSKRRQTKMASDQKLKEIIYDFLKNIHKLENTICSQENKIKELDPSLRELRESINWNIHTIIDARQKTDAYCDVHNNFKDIISVNCRHRVCKTCILDEPKCKRCAKSVQSVINPPELT